MQTSDFFDKDADTKEKQLIDSGSSTSITYKLSMDGRLYFMKQLRPEYSNDPRYRSLFFKEYECGKAISHPYVVRYTDMGEDEEGLYIIMEYVNGSSIKEKLLHEPTYFEKEENLYKLVQQLLEALQTLHQQNVVYMDMSPTNILLTKASNDVKLIDLGFCISDTNDLTGGCTEGFAAPEARTTDRPQLDARTDIYAVGCLLQYIEKKAKVRLPRLLQSIMLRCLQPEKEQRYQSVDEIIRRIKRRKVRRAAYMAGGLAVAIAAVVAFISSPLYTTLCDHMAWAMGSVPDRFEAKGVYYHITDHEARTVEVTFRGNTPDEYEEEYRGGRVYIPQTVTYRGCIFKVASVAGFSIDNMYVNRINIPEGMTRLEDNAFHGCYLDSIIYIPRSVEHIGEQAFEPHLYIEGFVVDEANAAYDSREGCNAIIETATGTLLFGCMNAFVPHGVVRIAPAAFIGAPGPEYLDIPPTVKEIGAKAFYHSGVKVLTIPESMTRIEDYTFQWSEQLRRVTLPATLTSIGQAAFSHCAFTELTIPDGVTHIADFAFDCCEQLQTLTLGAGVREIGTAAFEGCSRLSKVVSHIPASELFAIDRSTFDRIDKQCILYVPRGAKNTYARTPGWNYFTRIVEM